jgi:phosphate/sulfate permease
VKTASAWRVARIGVDLVIGLFAALSWSFAAFVLGTRFISPIAGGLLAVALLSSGVIAELRAQLSERRIGALLRGDCPRCGAAIVAEHRHRRWEPDRNEWLAPDTAWDCAGCGFSHSEPWDCPACPARTT